MSEPKKKYDMNTPEAKALIDEIVHGTFMKEGTMVAFPTCFPGASIPIVADESHITALDITPEGVVYGGTSGRQSHLFVGMFHGVTGMVFDLHTAKNATHCSAVCCGKTRFLACVDDETGGSRVLAAQLQPLPFDLIQEWGFTRPEFEDSGVIPRGEKILHAVSTSSRDAVVAITSNHLMTIDFSPLRIQLVGEIVGSGRIAVASGGSIVGLDGKESLWRYQPATQTLTRRAFPLPQGQWENFPVSWGRNRVNGLLHLADANGRLFSFDETKGFSECLGQTMLKPAGPMAATLDGRLFGFCGPDLAKMFCYDPSSRLVTNLGVAVSVLERRRYGYVFGDAVTGRDGQIYFGEKDNLGHLWIYFPSIKAK
jgi:hypothetical protein